MNQRNFTRNKWFITPKKVEDIENHVQTAFQETQKIQFPVKQTLNF